MKIKPKRTFITSGARSSFIRSFLFLTCFLLASTGIYAQTKTISGTVIDATNESLIGVSVKIQGTITGTVTDVDGVYSLSAKSGDVLEFTYVGMKAQLITVGSQSAINVTLEDDATMLGETVVIGYGTAKKRDLTGSIVSVKAADIANRPSSNPVASLQGKISGVQVVNTGRAGQDPEIRIRGTNSINGYKPLYVVDGLFHDNINFVNSSDIESMEILKDPSSLAIFGVRGANGVIIVTTKKAKEGQLIVNLNTSFGFKNVADKIKLTNASQFKELYSEQLSNQGNAAFDFSRWTSDTDWQDEIFQTGFITDNSASVTASTERSKFYMGIGHVSEEGSIKHEKFSKTTINLSSEFLLNKDIKIGFQFNGARMLPPDAKNVAQALRAAPIGKTYNEEYGLYYQLPSFQKTEIANPLVDAVQKKRTARGTNYRGGGNVYGEVNFLKNFSFKTTLSLDYRSDDLRSYTPRIEMYDSDVTVGNPVIVKGDGKTAVTQKKEDEMTAQSDFLLNYTNKFGDHSINAMAGFTTLYTRFSNLEASRKQGTYPIPNNPDKWYVSLGDPDASTNGSEQWERSTASILFRALYNYKNKYLFNGSYRRDGSSGFYYSGNEWQDFYSFGGGWLITDESFMEGTKGFMDYMKIKASWGLLGNQNMSKKYPAEPILISKNSAVFGDKIVPGYEIEYIPSKDLRWEKIKAWEAGLESNFLNNKLHFEGVFYQKRTLDLLAEVDGIYGVPKALKNQGEMRNQGVELAVSWNNKIGEDWTYGISANFTTISNKVTSLLDDSGIIIDGEKSISHTKVGYPIGYFYGYKVDGVYQTPEEISNSPRNTLATVKPGDLKFTDVNNDKVIDDKDRTMIGNPTPDFIYGLTLNLGYKNWELSVDMMGQEGNEIYRTWDNYNWSTFNYMSASLNRWNGAGTSNFEPILDKGRAINQLNSEYFIEDGSFFRIRNVQLAYVFSPQLLKKMRMKGLRAYINMQNLKTWKKNTGYTPEIGGDATAFGIDKDGGYPMPAVYTFGLNFTF